jgi:YVTN family beta-propeller protein
MLKGPPKLLHGGNMRGLRISAWILVLLFAFVHCTNNTSTSVPIAPATGIYAYVAAAETGTLSVVNTNTNEVVKTLPALGIRLLYLAINQSGSFVYAVTLDPNTSVSDITVISTSSNEVVDTFPSIEPTNIAFAADGTTAYMTTNGGNYVYVLNTTTKESTPDIEVQSGPGALALTPDGNFLYVVNTAALTVSVVSTATETVVTNIDLGVPSGNLPNAIAISPDGSKAYVTYFNPFEPQGPSGVVVIETASNSVVNTIDVPNEPASATVTSNGKWLYVAQTGGSSVAVIDTGTQAVTDTIPTSACVSPTGVTFSPDGAFAYVANGGTDVCVIDTAAGTVTNYIDVGNFPVSIVAMP